MAPARARGWLGIRTPHGEALRAVMAVVLGFWSAALSLGGW